MKAIVYENYGPPEVLHVAEVEKPTPKTGELLIKVHAAEATKSDCELRSFNFPVKWFSWLLRLALGVRKPKNKILGGYFSGEVVGFGPKASKFKIGDQIFGAAGFTFGAYGEFLCIKDTATLAHKPLNQSFAEAAAVPLGGLNALHFMRLAQIKTGDSVLINGAGGSIGLFAVQIAKSMGATVTAVDHKMKEAMLRHIGADHFVDYTKEDFTKCGRTYDVILDMVVRNSYRDNVMALNAQGRYLMGNPRMSDMVRTVHTNGFTDKSASFAFANEKIEELQDLKKMIEAGHIRAVVDQVYTMEQAAIAHQRVETEQRIGSIVIEIASHPA